MITSGVVLLATAAVPVAGAVVVRRQPAEVRSVLVRAVVVALLLRVIAGFALHGLGAWTLTERGAVTPDEAVIDYAARLRAAGDDRSPVVLGGSLHTSWLLVAASVYELWNSLLALKVLNAVLGAVLVVPVYVLGRELASPRAGLVAAWAIAVFPSAVVWSALALREPLIALVLTTLLAVLVQVVRERGSWSSVLGRGAVAVAALVVLAFSRSYMVPFVLALCVGAGLVGAASRRTWRPLVTVVAICVLALGSIALAPRGPELIRTTVALAGEQAPSVYNPFSDCSDESACLGTSEGPPAEALAPTTGSGRPAPPSTTQPDPTSSLQSVEEKGLVRALAIAVLAGRPVWRTEEYFLLLQPGVVVWWTVVPLVVLGGAALVRRRRLAEAALVCGFAVGIVLFLAYSGQFVRHHFMLEPAALALAAAGALAVRGGPVPRRRLVAAACGALLLAALASVVASTVSIG